MKKLFSLLLLFCFISCTNPYEVKTEDVVKYEKISNLYDEAENDDDDVKRNEVIVQYLEFIKEYDWSSKVDNSWFDLGMLYKNLEEYNNAINAFNNVYNKSSLYMDAQKEIEEINDLIGGN